MNVSIELPHRAPHFANIRDVRGARAASTGKGNVEIRSLTRSTARWASATWSIPPRLKNLRTTASRRNGAKSRRIFSLRLVSCVSARVFATLTCFAVHFRNDHLWFLLRLTIGSWSISAGLRPRAAHEHALPLGSFRARCEVAHRFSASKSEIGKCRPWSDVQRLVYNTSRVSLLSISLT